MKLSNWAKKKGISYNTALKWYHGGKIENSYQMDTGTIIVDENEKIVEDKAIYNYQKNVAVYARGFSAGDKEQVEEDLKTLENFALGNGFVVKNKYREISKEGERQILWKMIDKGHDVIIVKNKEALTDGENLKYLEKLLEKMKIELVIINKN